MDDLRIIIDSLTSDNQDLRNSVVKMNKEVHNINQINNQELKSNKYSPKAEEKENIFVYSNGL